MTEVDYLAEALILERIYSAFPDHQIHSEEAGGNGKRSDWLWLIDPLDGTNNYAIGLPIFTTSITLLYRKEPVLGVVYEPITDRLFVSSLGAGATCTRLWAPTLQWCLLAKGHLDGIVLYNSEGDDLYSGLLMVQEAGGSIVDFEGNAFRAMTDEPYLIACHPDRVNELLGIVHEGLKIRS
ncbi:inositol monophosphatase [Cohnella candidum]|uniref:inositol monophosphatase family protein n=1 Tax=Cohnella candidum TaxID=2674991 RepID=UPI0030B97815